VCCDGHEALVICWYNHVVSALSNEIAELLHKSCRIDLRMRNAPELANGARSRAGLLGKICNVDRYTVSVQRPRNCDHDSRNPTEYKNRTFQKVPCFSVRRLSVRRAICVIWGRLIRGTFIGNGHPPSTRV